MATWAFAEYQSTCSTCPNYRAPAPRSMWESQAGPYQSTCPTCPNYAAPQSSRSEGRESASNDDHSTAPAAPAAPAAPGSEDGWRPFGSDSDSCANLAKNLPFESKGNKVVLNKKHEKVKKFLTHFAPQALAAEWAKDIVGFISPLHKTQDAVMTALTNEDVVSAAQKLFSTGEFMGNKVNGDAVRGYLKEINEESAKKLFADFISQSGYDCPSCWLGSERADKLAAFLPRN